MIILFDASKPDSLEKAISEWYPIIKETLNPESSKILFVGTKIDLLNLELDPKAQSFQQEPLAGFETTFQSFKKKEEEAGIKDWVDWTYVSSLNGPNVQKVVERLVKHFSI